MGRQRDRSALVKDKLAKLADQDLSEVMRARAAVRKMVSLGHTPARLLAALEANPPVFESGQEQLVDNQPFMGFENRAQATLAAVSAMASPARPGVYGDTARRVEVLIKNQEPERGATTIGLAVVSVPAMMVGSAQNDVKRFKRMPSGELRALGPAGQVVEMQEETEAVFSIKKQVP